MLIMIIDKVISIINILILIRIVLSWLAPYSNNGFTDLVYGLTEPILRPFRVLIPIRNIRIDISPIIACIFFSILRKIIYILIG